jgi:hypothetical protein
MKGLPRAGKRKTPCTRTNGRKSEKIAVEIPNWTPPVVRNIAEGFYEANRDGADPELSQILDRLASDPRMRRVWKELTKQSRNTDVNPSHFVYAATAPGRQTSWTPQARSMRQYAEDIRRAGRPAVAELLDLNASLYELTNVRQILAGPEPTLVQDSALQYFFYQVVCLSRYPPKPITLSEALKIRRPYTAMASQLRADASTQGRGAIRERLQAAADAYEG